MHLVTILTALAAATSVLGSPAAVGKRAPSRVLYASNFINPTSPPALEKRITECQAVNAVVSALQVVSKLAYPFCSTYISIKDITATATLTTTVTPSPVQVTSTVTPAATTVTTSTTVTTTSGTTTIYSSYTPTAAHKEKRNAPTLPAYCSAFGASQVSKACSCLSIPPKTTTVSTTVSTTLPVATITSTVTAATPTSTFTSTITVTVSSTATYPAICQPSALTDTSGVLGTAGKDFPQIISSPASTALDCCVACFNTPNCLSYATAPCQLFVTVDAHESSSSPAQAALCPLGVNSQDTLFPPGITTDPAPNGFRPGPCVVDALPFL